MIGIRSSGKLADSADALLFAVLVKDSQRRSHRDHGTAIEYVVSPEVRSKERYLRAITENVIRMLQNRVTGHVS